MLTNFCRVALFHSIQFTSTDSPLTVGAIVVRSAKDPPSLPFNLHPLKTTKQTVDLLSSQKHRTVLAPENIPFSLQMQ